MRHGHFQRCVAAGTLALLAGVAPRAEDFPPAHDPFEPAVTAREAAVLRAAAEMSATNLTAAIAWLQPQVTARSSPALDFALGTFYFQADKLSAAETAYQAALTKMPTFRHARINLGRVYLLQGQGDKTARLYQSLVRDGQGTHDTYLLLGHALLLQNQAVSAESAYRQALLLHPGEENASIGLAKALFLQERHREAIALLKEVLARHPRHTECWVLRAQAHLSLEQFRDAIVCLECARRLGVTNAHVLATLGDLYLQHAQSEDARACYEQIATTPAFSPRQMCRAIESFLAAGQTNAAAQLLDALDRRMAGEAANAETEARLETWRLKAELARLRGETATALHLYENILREAPTHGGALLALGDLRRQENRIEEALLAYERASRIAGFESRALTRQAQIEVERRQYARAVELLEAALGFEEKPHVRRYLEQVRRLADLTVRP